MLESLILLISLIAGYYFFRPKNINKSIKIINTSLNHIVILIILLMGYNFSIFTQANSIILNVTAISLLYTIIIFIANITGVFIFCYFIKKAKDKYVDLPNNNQKDNILILILSSFKYMGYLALGYIIGEVFKIDFTNIINDLTMLLLLALMVIIGMLLRLENIGIQDIFKNKIALSVVLIIIFTSLLSGILISFFVDIPLKQSIMICSGLGWYSLSVVLNTQFIGQYYGIITFLVDFLREMVVISLIPLLRNQLSIELVGYAANTAMDFSLPVIKNNYGIKIVPLAISTGLILTIVTPALVIIENIIL